MNNKYFALLTLRVLSYEHECVLSPAAAFPCEQLAAAGGSWWWFVVAYVPSHVQLVVRCAFVAAAVFWLM